ncbi:hypothetical protein NKH18_42990 [Streptomyces sp. M10(2022)]
MVVGHIADRRGLRNVLVCMYLFHACVAAATPFIDSFTTAAVLIGLTTFSFEGSRAVRHAAIARLGGAERAHFRAQLRSISNVGMALGSVFAGIAAQLDTRASFTVALWQGGDAPRRRRAAVHPAADGTPADPEPCHRHGSGEAKDGSGAPPGSSSPRPSPSRTCPTSPSACSTRPSTSRARSSPWPSRCGSRPVKSPPAGPRRRSCCSTPRSWSSSR